MMNTGLYICKRILCMISPGKFGQAWFWLGFVGINESKGRGKNALTVQKVVNQFSGKGNCILFQSLQIWHNLIIILGKILLDQLGQTKWKRGKKKNHQRFSEFLFMCFQIPVLDMLCMTQYKTVQLVTHHLCTTSLICTWKESVLSVHFSFE